MINVPEILREKLGPEGAQALVELLNRLGHDTRDEVILLAEERFARRVAEEIRGVETRLTRALADVETRLEQRLGEETGKLWSAIAALETRLIERITAGDARLDARITSLEARLTSRMATLETRVLRWSFAFWATQAILLLGILVALLRRG